MRHHVCRTKRAAFNCLKEGFFLKTFFYFLKTSSRLYKLKDQGGENRNKGFTPNHDGLGAIIHNWGRLVPLKLVHSLPVESDLAGSQHWSDAIAPGIR